MKKKDCKIAKQKILQECKKQGVTNKNQIKYILATMLWETNRTCRPVKEAYWLTERWRKNNLRYYPYYGRSYIQITWKAAYQKFSDLLGVDMVKNPDLALESKYAAFIIVYGMKNGTFTGKKLSDYISKKKIDFRRARKIVNGLDKAKKIAKIAESIAI